MFLPENIECILLLCQDNFKLLASKLKISAEVGQSVGSALYLCQCDSLFCTKKLVNYSVFILLSNASLKKISKLWVDQCFRLLDSNSSKVIAIATQPRRNERVTSLEKSWMTIFPLYIIFWLFSTTKQILLTNAPASIRDIASRVYTSLSLAWYIFIQESNYLMSQPPEAIWRSTELQMDKFQEKSVTNILEHRYIVILKCRIYNQGSLRVYLPIKTMLL